MRRVGHILLQVPFIIQRSPRQIIIADDCFQHLRVPLDRSSQVVIKSTEKLFGSMFFLLCASLQLDVILQTWLTTCLASFFVFFSYCFSFVHEITLHYLFVFSTPIIFRASIEAYKS